VTARQRRAERDRRRARRKRKREAWQWWGSTPGVGTLIIVDEFERIDHGDGSYTWNIKRLARCKSATE